MNQAWSIQDYTPIWENSLMPMSLLKLEYLITSSNISRRDALVTRRMLGLALLIAGQRVSIISPSCSPVPSIKLSEKRQKHLAACAPRWNLPTAAMISMSGMVRWFDYATLLRKLIIQEHEIS
jgi:hypothetical protein